MNANPNRGLNSFHGILVPRSPAVDLSSDPGHGAGANVSPCTGSVDTDVIGAAWMNLQLIRSRAIMLFLRDLLAWLGHS